MAAPRNLTTRERVQELVDYDPLTGVFVWRHRPDARPGVNTAFAGRVAGETGKNGYRYVRIDGSRYLAHRLAWLLVTGHWPEHHVDHINGVRADNRIANLREATPSQNQHNRRKRPGTKSKLKGVAWYAAYGMWTAQLRHEGKLRHLGYFKTEEEAHAAYCEAAQRLYGEYARYR